MAGPLALHVGDHLVHLLSPDNWCTIGLLSDWGMVSCLDAVPYKVSISQLHAVQCEHITEL